MKWKTEVLQKFKEFDAATTNEEDAKLKLFASTTEENIMLSDFEEYLKSKGIKRETSVAHCPQQNCVTKRVNRTLAESAKATVYHAKLSKIFEAEAVSSAAYIRNRVVTSASSQAPYERWYGKPPDVSHFKVFGLHGLRSCS